MPRTQEFRQLAVATPLGEDVLLLRRFRGGEPLGRLFEYELDLISERGEIRLEDVVGHNVTVRVQQSQEGEPRYFNGFVSRFTVGRPLGATTEYEATIVPWLWFLTRTSDCRIFQEMTTADIIKEVFRGHGFTDFEDRLTGTGRTWEYCVQYCETDFSFVSRLMEQEGLFYYFLHEDGKHTLVLADAASPHDAAVGYEEVMYRPPTSSLREKETIRRWTMSQRVQPGTYSHSDFDFKKPATSLLASAKIERPYATPDFEMYEYPGEYVEPADGEAYARRRIEAYHIEYEAARGEGDVRGITTGRRFVLTGHPREDQCKRYLVTGTEIEATSDLYESGPGGAAGGPDEGQEADDGEASFTVRFTAIDLYHPFRLRRTTPRPMIRGPQTAIVVGPAGEEIHTDEYGRVKVQFHWDRYSKADENSSCWIRVAQLWAGRNWGGMFIPRIGQEVIVEFLEGDPDRPLITGRVYNGRSMPPYELPANMTLSGVKTNSSKGGQGFNEIRFEDKKGEEQLFVHAEKNQDVRVKNDSFETIGNDRHLIVRKDQYEHVENNRHEIVDADHKEQVGKDRHREVTGKEAIKVGGSRSLTVGGDVIEVFQAANSRQITGDLYVKAANIVLEATTTLTLKVGQSCVVVDQSGVTDKGAQLVLDGENVRIASGPGSPAGMGLAGQAVTPTAPTAAEEADQADPGEMAEVKARQREQQAGKYGSAKVKPFKPPKVPSRGAPPVPIGPVGATTGGQTTQQTDRELTWIEVQLVDNVGNGVAGEPYAVTLPDGTTVAEGTLNEKGLVRIDGIDPGTCQITFPALDGRSWDRTT